MAGKYRILIVDDERTLREVFKEGMLSLGHACDIASNGQAALEQLGANDYDVMVTDIIMPGMDGLELTYKAKQIKPDMAVIVMTGFQQDESYDRAIGFGAADFVKKPFSVEELAMRIERVMRDTITLSEIRRKQEEVRAISREMISGVQDEAAERIAALELEIVNLRKKIS